MPLSELVKAAAEEMRRLAKEPTDEEKLALYGLYKQAIHGDIPEPEDYSLFTAKPSDDDEWALRKYNSWFLQKGKTSEACKAEYVKLAEEMIKKYERKIIRSKWNSEVWSVDY
uniref:ACB domain-containing protein n=1 Tax=Syphacia muris TaxID=451379 RepID=A0A0N5AX06_9BILA